MDEPQIKTKFCPVCKQEKDVELFHKSCKAKDGKQRMCEKCSNENLAKWRNKHPLKSRESDRAEFKERKIKEPIAQRSRFYKNTFLKAYKNLTALGLSKETIELLFGLNKNSLDYREKTDIEIQQARQEAMKELEQRLCRTMLVQAVGYNYDEEKIVYNPQYEEGEPSPQWIAAKKETVSKHHPGSPESLMNFLTNKFPDLWKRSSEIVRKLEGYDASPGQRDRKKVESQAREFLEASADRPEAEHSV